MRISNMQEYILVTFIERLDLADRPFRGFMHRQVIRIDNEPMKAARDAVIDSFRSSHDVDAIVPKLRSAF